MSFFRFVDKRAIYRWHNLIRTCAGECDWHFHWQHKLCATFSTNVNINYCLPIKAYYRICTLRHIRIEINHGRQNLFWVLMYHILKTNSEHSSCLRLVVFMFSMHFPWLSHRTLFHELLCHIKTENHTLSYIPTVHYWYAYMTDLLSLSKINYKLSDLLPLYCNPFECSCLNPMFNSSIWKL